MSDHDYDESKSPSPLKNSPLKDRFKVNPDDAFDKIEIQIQLKESRQKVDDLYHSINTMEKER